MTEEHSQEELNVEKTTLVVLPGAVPGQKGSSCTGSSVELPLRDKMGPMLCLLG